MDDNPQYVVCPVVMNQQGLWRLLNCPLRMSLASILHTERPEIMKHWDNVTTIQGMLSAALPKCEKPKGQQQESNRIYFSRKKSSHNLTMIHHVIVVLWCWRRASLSLFPFHHPSLNIPKWFGTNVVMFTLQLATGWRAIMVYPTIGETHIFSATQVLVGTAYSLVQRFARKWSGRAHDGAMSPQRLTWPFKFSVFTRSHGSLP